MVGLEVLHDLYERLVPLGVGALPGGPWSLALAPQPLPGGPWPLAGGQQAQ